jgi:pimeloyl-ACP methyl ester carboxylesterase
VVLFGTPAPQEAVPWIPPAYLASVEQLRGRGPEEVHAALAGQLAGLIPAAGHILEALRLLGAGPADEPALAQPGARDRLAVMLEAAFAQGIIGQAADIAGYCLQPWGFEPGDVAAKTLLLYGAQDPVAGARHGSWWQKHLPNARLEVVPGAGHLCILTMWARALSHLAPGLKRQQ